VFRLNLLRFTIAIAVGRIFRYSLEGYLAAHYGEHAKEILAHYYPWIGLSLAVLLILVFVGKNLMRRANRVAPVSGVDG
jgi:membrane protein DedA with SNARE-associated domain